MGAIVIQSLGRRARRLVESLRYRFRTRLRMPVALVTAAIVLFTAFIVGGGIYDILDEPPTILQGPQGYIAVRGSMQDQTLMESILVMILTILIFAGLFSSYRSTQIIYDSRRATTMLLLGIFLILLGLSGSYYLLRLKGIILSRFGI